MHDLARIISMGVELQPTFLNETLPNPNYDTVPIFKSRNQVIDR